jgi:DNA-binding MarR family transcriptional regulator
MVSFHRSSPIEQFDIKLQVQQLQMIYLHCGNRVLLSPMTKTSKLRTATEHTRTNSFGWMLQRITGQLDAQMRDRLLVHDLTIQQFATLMIVMENDGVTQRDIGDTFAMQPYIISRALDHLETLGLVDRIPHPTSRRAVHVIATTAATNLAPKLFGIIADVNADLVAPLSDTQTDALRDILVTLMQRP